MSPCRMEAAVTEDKEGKCLRLKKRGLTTSGPVEGEGPLSLGGHAALPWVLDRIRQQTG